MKLKIVGRLAHSLPGEPLFKILNAETGEEIELVQSMCIYAGVHRMPKVTLEFFARDLELDLDLDLGDEVDLGEMEAESRRNFWDQYTDFQGVVLNCPHCEVIHDPASCSGTVIACGRDDCSSRNKTPIEGEILVQ